MSACRRAMGAVEFGFEIFDPRGTGELIGIVTLQTELPTESISTCGIHLCSVTVELTELTGKVIDTLSAASTESAMLLSL